MTEQNEHRAKVIHKAILQLTDHLMIANDQFFRPLTEKAITDAEYGEIQLSAAVNHLRYTIYTRVSPESREFVIDKMAEAMKIEPQLMSEEDIAKEEAEKKRKAQAIKDKEAELEYVIKMKQEIEDNLHRPKDSDTLITM